MATFAGHPIVVPYIIESLTRTFASDTVSLRRSIIDSGAQRWQIRFAVRPDTRGSLLADLHAHRLEHRYNAFTQRLPQHRGASTTGTLRTATGAARGSESLSVRAEGLNTDIAAGSLFALGSKVYMVTGALSATIGGASTMRIFPALVADTSSGVSIEFSETVPMRVRYVPDSNEAYAYNAGGLAQATIELEEAL